MVTVSAAAGDIVQTNADAIVVNLFEGVTTPGGGTGAVDRALDGAISSLIADGEISGKAGETTVIHAFGKIAAKRVVVAGLGKQERFDAHAARATAANAARCLRRVGAANAATLAHGAGVGGLSPRESAEATALGSILGLYRFNAYKSANGSNGKDVASIAIVEHDAAKLPDLEAGAAHARLLADCVTLTRDMANEPANVVNPARMAEIAQSVAEETGLSYAAMGREEMLSYGMGALLGVAQGSANEPRLILLEHRGDPANPANNVAIVGKGVTFDTGGISLKVAENMGAMKGDMSGGASIIGAMRAVALLKPPINVLGVVPAVENMPSGTAQRPGDIVRAMNGKTIEVDNTDAEGRLILADAIAYAIKEKGARRVVDVATLTGAMVVALGNVNTGVMGSSQELVDAVLAASRKAGEKMWQLPINEEYKERIHSDWADVKNTGGRPAGSITAALFISEFADGADWAHLDIAGTNMSDKDRGHVVKGATGVPVLTLVQLVQDLAANGATR